jgi:hypothetical protein
MFCPDAEPPSSIQTKSRIFRHRSDEYETVLRNENNIMFFQNPETVNYIDVKKQKLCENVQLHYMDHNNWSPVTKSSITSLHGPVIKCEYQ